MKALLIIGYCAMLFFSSMYGTQSTKTPSEHMQHSITFGEQVEFLKRYQNTIVLKKGAAQLAICPAYQGRVMTSTSGGQNGKSYGWINRELIGSGKIMDKINPVGGEDRFWLGPEGGQFSIFFEKDAEFTLEDWQTPSAIDTETFPVIASTDSTVTFYHEFEIENYSSTIFQIGVEREISFISDEEVSKLLGDTAELNLVAYQSNNLLINRGDNSWNEETGALSIWILGMYNPSLGTSIVLPYLQSNPAETVGIVNDTYFGEVPKDRLKIKDGVVYFKGDGLHRSKIGIGPQKAKDVMGSFDATNNVLTIVKYSKPVDVSAYVNSMWELQDYPFSGDVVNSYNDGPVNGSALGPFYELETSSPAAFLESGGKMEHIHQTYHIEGEEEALNRVALKVLGVSLESIKTAFN